MFKLLQLLFLLNDLSIETNRVQEETQTELVKETIKEWYADVKVYLKETHHTRARRMALGIGAGKAAAIGGGAFVTGVLVGVGTAKIHEILTEDPQLRSIVKLCEGRESVCLKFIMDKIDQLEDAPTQAVNAVKVSVGRQVVKEFQKNI
ncbi:hypothetical protein QR680_010008 [Steinernema hermaphroditum]|uniref:Uncharacterized protein n=1 Tax=Steinernema hermaphroditum TaxID=289476 RepID=A0AA39INS2_9BILA|nr:hypothetical protein QR680_010008 [Steinernema hermaphroditum]